MNKKIKKTANEIATKKALQELELLKIETEILELELILLEKEQESKRLEDGQSGS